MQSAIDHLGKPHFVLKVHFWHCPARYIQLHERSKRWCLADTQTCGPHRKGSSDRHKVSRGATLVTHS